MPHKSCQAATLTEHPPTMAVAKSKVLRNCCQYPHASAELVHHRHPSGGRYLRDGGDWHPDNARSDAPN